MTTQPIERPDANQLLLTGGKAPESVDFGQAPPSRIMGKLINGPTTYHAREYDAKNPGQGPLRYWPDNNPVYGVFVDLDIPGRGMRRLYVEKLRMLSAIQEAMLRAGVRKLDHGGWLGVDWTGTEIGQGNLPANTYTADWTPPTAGAVPPGNAVLGNGGPMMPPAQSGPATWQQGVPGATNGAPTQPYVAGGLIPQQHVSAQAPAPQAYVPAQVQHVPAPAPAPVPVPAQPAAPVLTETIAAAMRNAGIPTDGYAIIPG